jgi:hypothetical protein
MSNHEILGVSPTASREEIKKAYRQLSMRYHPDISGGDSGEFLKIKEAYEALIQFNPNHTHNIFTWQKYSYFVIVYGTYYDSSDGSINIDVGFSRDMIYAKIYDKNSIRHSWTLIGLNRGNLNINKKTLLRNNYKFDMHFISSSGRTIVKEFEFDDPRSKIIKLKDKHNTPLFYIRLFLRAIIVIVIYYIIYNIIF